MIADSILAAVLYALTFPFYMYAFIKWFEWKDHCLFRYRYSKDAAYIICVAIILNHLIISYCFLQDIGRFGNRVLQPFISVYFAVAYLFWMLAYYRVNLIYLTWKQYQEQLYETIDSKPVSNPKSLRKHWSSIILLVSTIIGSVLIIFAHFVNSDMLTLYVWCYCYLAGIIIFIKIKYNKVKESLGLLFEIYFFYVGTFTWWIIAIFAQKYLNLVSIIAYHFIPLFTLYYALYLLYKYEGTLSKNRLNSNDDLKMLEAVHTHVQAVQTNSTTISIQPTEKTPAHVQSDVGITATKISLADYLTSSDQYEKFRKYLTQCFCLENLMFVTRVCILKCYVMKLKYKKEIDQLSGENLNAKMFSMKFTYFKTRHEEYDNKFNIASDFETNRELLWNECHDVWKQFIRENSVNEINLPYLVRFELNGLLDSKHKIDEFESYDNFLNVFDDAAEEIWRLLHGIYNFRFASYLKQYVQNK